MQKLNRFSQNKGPVTCLGPEVRRGIFGLFPVHIRCRHYSCGSRLATLARGVGRRTVLRGGSLL